jgi:NAD(P)-dependent dehydrogenase (short-subunit alcohol dehydrogenase family)
MRNCLVTGGTSGVGRGIARALAGSGARVIIVSRDAGRAAAAAESLRRQTGNASVDWVAADLSSMSSVRALADTVRARCTTLHLLSLNAAALTMQRELTPEGVESIFATNYLGHFLLANLLTDALRAGAPSRVLTVVGQARPVAMLRPRFEDLRSDRGFNPLRATLRAAIAKTLFTFELARRLSGSGVTANAFSPGLVRSGLPLHMPWYLGLPVRFASLFFAEASDTGAYLALSPEVEGVSGRFFQRRKAVLFSPKWDAAAAGRELWEISARLCGIT